jgi:hypothetical protein
MVGRLWVKGYRSGAITFTASAVARTAGLLVHLLSMNCIARSDSWLGAFLRVAATNDP